MADASRCHEALGNWDQAELWMRRTSERYESSRTDWYLWCQRTGHGDEAAARKLALTYCPKLEERAGEFDLQLAGVIYLLGDDDDKAKAPLQRDLERSGNPYAGLHLALAAMATDDPTTCDAALKTTIERGHEYLFKYRATPKRRGRDPDEPSRMVVTSGAPAEQKAALKKAEREIIAWEYDARPLLQCGQFASMIWDVFAAEAPHALDLERVDMLLDTGDLRVVTNLSYFVGRFLLLRGRTEEAIPYLRKAATSTDVRRWNYILARVALRDLGVPVNEATSEPAAQ